MNKIVREHYPVADLPDNLRAGLEPGTQVRVTIEAEAFDLNPPEKVMTLDEMFALTRPHHRTTEQIVGAIRRERDAWDD